MSAVQIPINFTDSRGDLNPMARQAMYQIASLFNAAVPGILPEAFTYTPLGGTPFGLVYLDAAGALTATGAMTNGQLLIGRTGLSPVLQSLTGTVNRISVTNGAGTITLTTPQDIDNAASPTFSALTLSSLTAHSFLYSGAGEIISSTAAATNGKLLIGSTGADPVAANLTGTASQITVTNGAGSITLSLPQNIDSSATPDFTGLIGTITNDAAASGVIGEFITSFIPAGSPVALTTGAIVNITSISLSAGDWDVSGFIGFVGNVATTATSYLGESSSNSGAWSATAEYALLTLPSAATGAQQQMVIPIKRFSLAITTTIYLVGGANFLVNTLGAFGRISARRMR